MTGTAQQSFLVDLLEEDPELEEAVTTSAEAVPRTLGLTLDPGVWEPDLPTAALGLLVLAGFLTRRVELAGRHSVELLGGGDLVRMRDLGEDEYAMVPSRVSWRALDRVRLAVLDARFAAWAIREPQLVDRLLSRSLRRSRTLALRLALAQVPRLSARLYFLLWHLADRFGRVHGNGMLLPVPLPHSMLADLVSAQRPSVSRGMKALERRGLVTVARGGGWFLCGLPPSGLNEHDPKKDSSSRPPLKWGPTVRRPPSPTAPS